MTANLGELKSVDVRKAWRYEAHNFTPWLADNLEWLGEAVGIPNLTLVDQEAQVGPFRADIIASAANGDSVLIENQLEAANLQHLGQVLAYLAGLDSKIVIWVATEFHESYLSAIRWLNEHTPDHIAFFAVRVGLVQIEDSKLAPVLEVLERPSEWTPPPVPGEAKESERTRFRREFWEHYRSTRPDAGIREGFKGLYHYHTIRQPSGLRVAQVVNFDGVLVYLVAKRGTDEDLVKAKCHHYANALEEHGISVRWPSWAGTYKHFDTRDPDNWDDMVQWLDKRREVYERVLRNVVPPEEMETPAEE